MPGILVYASIVCDAVSMPTREILGAARGVAAKTGEPVSAALLGSGISSLTQDLIEAGADSVHVCDNEKLWEFHANAYLKVLADIAASVNPRMIIFPGEAAAIELAPRLAHRLKGGLITDCIGFEVREDAVIFTKPVYGSKALARMRVDGPTALVTVRPRTQEPFGPDQNRKGDVVTVETALGDIAPETRTVERVEEEVFECILEEANVVVSGGRGMKDPESFQQLRELATLLNGAMGATRVAVDQGMVPPSCQIGLTGKIVAPEVYFAVGISGASQHIAGMSGSKYIVAINSDPDAPIFSISNVGVVEDYRNVMPTLIDELRKALA
ncbi:MAG: electron transfer flavoprotein subunit alpha/FixB family protein [Desulfobacterales bacterium]|nr:electron transfer flavoprotein subunit alpha/FixB family protein [Desulfobacterales bacterium]